MRLYSIYFFDLFFKSIYFLISFFILFLLFFCKITDHLLFEILPFIKIFYYKRFIMTGVIDLFNMIWVTSFFYSSLFIFPLLVHWTFLFFKPGWYSYQELLYKIATFWFYCCFIVGFFFFHLNIIPVMLDFFLHRELTDPYYLVRIEPEISFLSYILWISVIKCNFSFIFSYLVMFMFTVFLFKKISSIHGWLKSYIKLLSFILIGFLYLLIPPDFMVQTFLILIIYCYNEFFYYIVCLFLYKTL